MNYSKSLLTEINREYMTDAEMITLWQTKPQRIKTIVETQLWLKYQPLIKATIRKWHMRYRVLSDFDVEDLMQDMFFVFVETPGKINKVYDGFSFGAFVKMQLVAHMKSVINAKQNEMNREYYTKTASIHNDDTDHTIEDIASEYYTPDQDAVMLEVKSLYDSFKKEITNKRDKKMLTALERYNGIKKDKDIYPKLGFASQPAFWYQKEKLKKQYVDYMHKAGYQL